MSTIVRSETSSVHTASQNIFARDTAQSLTLISHPSRRHRYTQRRGNASPFRSDAMMYGSARWPKQGHPTAALYDRHGTPMRQYVLREPRYVPYRKARGEGVAGTLQIDPPQTQNSVREQPLRPIELDVRPRRKNTKQSSPALRTSGA